MAEQSTLPALPARPKDFLAYLNKHSDKSPIELLKPYREYDAKIRELFAQKPGSVQGADVNVVSVFDGPGLKTRARKMDEEDAKEKDCYIMPLSDEHRHADGTPATVESLKEFKHNFSVFTEMSLVDLDWNNIVVAGSATLTPLLPVPKKYKESKRALRQYYHEELAPASDVDIFLYGLDEEQAKEKIKQIEAKVRDSILQEVTCIRTKNAITIASQYPTRHVQIVLRIYKSISEILTGFDVDCSCVAFDGEKVWAAPRALQAMMTQVNHIDLSRRSPSYENRLSKYSHRGFEIFWPALDRSRVDPTIYERSFMRTEGLARLLVLEKLPGSKDRDNYANLRRRERGRPELNLWRKNLHKLKGNIKNDYEDEVADWWLDQEEVSDYHTFTIPYGEKFNAKKIEKLLYTKDLLLNAEWNRSKDREVNLHRHPAFFGSAEDVFGDCCGYCPKPVTDEEFKAAEGEDRIYVKGEITFMQDDPGRQQIGSFNPITDLDWTEMAYVGNSERLCSAIVDGDLEHVQSWLAQKDANPNSRDHTGRTPLQLAVQCSTPEIVRSLVEADVRIIARMANGYTALHLAAQRGNVEMIKIILERSERNEAEYEEKEAIKKEERKKALDAEETQSGVNHVVAAKNSQSKQSSDEENDDENWDSDFASTSMASESFVKVKKEAKSVEDAPLDNENADDPDFYDVNILAWDQACSPLHLAILNGHIEAVEVLVGMFGADILLPIKLLNEYDKSPRAAVLTLVLALALPQVKARKMAKTLLDWHASSSQADLKGISALHYYANDGSDALDFLLEHDQAAAVAALSHLAVAGSSWSPQTNSALLTAISNADTIACLKILENGVAPEISFSSWIRQARTALDNKMNFNHCADPEYMNKLFKKSVEQPLVVAINNDVTEVAMALLAAGANPNTLPKTSAELIGASHAYRKGQSVLDLVRAKLDKLKQYNGEKNIAEPPLAMKSNDEYLKDIEPGSYKHWVASTSIKYATERYYKEKKDYEQRVKEFECQKGLQEKFDAVRKAIDKYNRLEADLVKRGAKTFKELHPDVQDPVGEFHRLYQPYRANKKPFEISFSFRVGELNDELKLRYLELFEAAWIGDLDTIKLLTLVLQGKDMDQPPLRIAVQDQDGASPFSIAVMRGHLDVAKAILEICLAQYSPKEKEETARYTMTKQEDEYEHSDSDIDSDEDGDIKVYKQIVDDKFTIDNIGELSMKIDSHITPLEYLGWSCPTMRFSDGHIINKASSANSLLGYSIDASEHDLLIWLLEIGHYYSTTKTENGISPVGTFYSIGSGYLQQAIKLGRTQMIAELLKRTGCGIPFEDLVKKSGVKMKEKPKYYQGLSVYGKKRADWAAAGRKMQVQTISGSQISPLLMAAKLGTLESLEYLISDTPLRLYFEFAAMNRNDKRVKRLNQAKGGIEKSISNWYLANEESIVSCAVIGEPSKAADRRLEYLVKAYPKYMDTKSSRGVTPLQLAFKLGRHSAARILLEAGAHTTIRDKAANNLIQKLLVPFNLSNEGHIYDLKAMLELLDEETRHALMLQRNAASNGGGSPLHNWLNARMNTYGGNNDMDRMIVELLLSYSKGNELSLINGAGDTPLHSVITGRRPDIAKQLLTHNPELLYGENATGRTPFELARDMYTALKLKDPPAIGSPDGTYYSYSYCNDIRTVSDKGPSAFTKDDGPEDKRSVEEKIWDLCKEMAAKHPGKRKLVSLNEANEVARRLGDMAVAKKRTAKKRTVKQREFSVGEDEAEGDEADVVERWVADAVAWVKVEEADDKLITS